MANISDLASEESLRESEERYKLLFHLSPAGIFQYDTSLIITEANEQFAEILQASRDQLIGLDMTTLKDRVIIPCLAIVLEGKEGFYEGLYHATSSPAVMFVSVRTVPIFDEQGEVQGGIGIVEDITERKRAEEALYRLATIVRSTDDAIISATPARMIDSWNQGAEKLYGYSADEIIGQPVSCLIPPHREVEAEAIRERVLLGERIEHFETERLRKDGTIVPVSMTMSPILSASGTIIGISSIARDITERKKAEALRAGQNQILEMIALNAPLEEVLTSLTLLIEAQSEGMLCSVLFLEEDGVHIRHAAAPSLPDSYIKIIDGASIGPRAGSCGTAMYRGEPVIVTDILEDPLWEDYRHIAAPYGLRACWSTPIVSPQGKMLGSFAMYYREPRSPSPAEERLISIATNIAGIAIERQRSVEALRASEKRFAIAFQLSPAALSINTLADGRFLAVNDQLLRATGYTREEVIGHTSPELHFWTSAEERERAMQQLKQQGSLRNLDHTFRMKSGEVRDTLFSMELIELDGQECVLLAAIDITKRKRIEEELRRSTAEISDLYNNAPCGYHSLDRDGTFIRINDTELAWLGYTRGEMIGRMNIADVITPESLEVFQTEQRWMHNVELEMVRKDGTPLPALLSTTAVRDDGGNFVMTNSTVFDITERKRLEEELQQSQKMEAVGRLAGGIAHDFNNLLTAIKGYSDLSLRRLSLTDPVHRNINEIKKAADRAASLTRQLLAFSRKQVLQPRVFDINAVVSDMDNLLRRLIGEDIELITARESQAGYINADPGQIEQVILNLAVNARDAMPKGGSLTIETANVELDEESAHQHIAVSPGLYVRLSVTDTGCGMDAQTQARVFEPFFTTKEVGKGTGLGLSTVYGIVKQSGGHIWVHSHVGRGATFEVYLPRIGEGVKRADSASTSHGLVPGTETVLLVEDEEMVRSMTREILEENGYHILEAEDGKDALVKCAQHEGPIHLMVTDVVMPQMGGRELAERLATIRPEMKVIYMSGYTDDAIVHHGVTDAGAPFIQKPFAPDDLVRKVQEVLHQTEEN